MNGENKLIQRKLLKRVAITGPESTGKSWLTSKLSFHYDALKVDEYAREYFQDRKYEYEIDDLVEIAKSQLKHEDSIAQTSKKIIFCDTDLVVMKIWSKVVFGNVPDWIEKKLKEHVYDLYLLCYHDIDWEPDPLRSNPHNRQYIYDLFVKELEQNNFNYKVVVGTGEDRLKNAINFVDELL